MFALAGMDAALKILQARERRSHQSQAQETGQPVFGMPGSRFTPQGGFT